MQDCVLAFDATATCDDFVLTVRLDGQDIYSGPATHRISHAFSDSGQHVLEIQLSGKNKNHTTVDAQGNITQDQVLTISNVTIDSVTLGQLFYDHSEYQHDYNGSGPVTREKFWGTMGCNGVVTMQFSSPVYLWLLENM